MLRGFAPPSQADSLGEALRELDSAGADLRGLVDQYGQPAPALVGRATLLQQQTAWLLTEPLSLDLPKGEALGAAETGPIADVAELILLAIVPWGTPAKAHVAVAVDGTTTQIRLTVTVPDRNGSDDGGTAQAAVNEVGRAVGSPVSAVFGDGQWRAAIALPRQALVEVHARQSPRGNAAHNAAL